MRCTSRSTPQHSQLDDRRVPRRRRRVRLYTVVLYYYVAQTCAGSAQGTQRNEVQCTVGSCVLMVLRSTTKYSMFVSRVSFLLLNFLAPRSTFKLSCATHTYSRHTHTQWSLFDALLTAQCSLFDAVPSPSLDCNQHTPSESAGEYWHSQNASDSRRDSGAFMPQHGLLARAWCRRYIAHAPVVA